MKWRIFFWIPAALFLAGCAAAPTGIEKKDVATFVIKPAEESPAAPLRLFAERDLLLDGVALLNLQDRPDPEKARSVFISLIQRYPQSRWRSAAEAFIRLIDERDAFREASRQDHLLIGKTQGEKAKALQENVKPLAASELTINVGGMGMSVKQMTALSALAVDKGLNPAEAVQRAKAEEVASYDELMLFVASLPDSGPMPFVEDPGR